MAPSTRHNRVYPLRSGPSVIATAASCRRPLSEANQASTHWRDFWLCLLAILWSPRVHARYPLDALSSEAKSVFPIHGFLRPPRSQVQPAPPAVSKLRKWMSCRRGSSRGQSGRQATSPMTDSSTSDLNLRSNRYPVTRSGRGRGRGIQIPVPSSFHSTPNAARLHFPYSHGSSTFMATVTIELDELNASHGARSFKATSNRPVADNPGPNKENVYQSKASGSGKGKASQNMKNPASSSNDDEDNKFGCRITEEPPDPSPEA